MSDTKTKRDVKIEIIRLIACFMVIWYHIREVVYIGKPDFELKETVVFFECICTICVMTFFLITGFYIYNMKGNIISDWIKLLKKLFFNILIPFFAVCIFCLIFHNFLISRESFVTCIEKIDVQNIFYKLYLSIIHLDVGHLTDSAGNPIGTAGHLWYVYSYAIIIFAYPITRYILTKFPKHVVYVLLAILTICMVVNDYHLFYGNPSFNIVFKIIPKPIYYSACGYVLYNDIIKKQIDRKDEGKSLIINKPLFFISIAIYVVTFVLLLKTQCNYYLYHHNNGTDAPYVYTSWLSLYSLFLTSAFILIVYNINFEKLLNDSIRNMIFFVSKMTLGIYLVHYLIKTKLESIGFQQKFFVNRPNIFYHFAYFIVYSFIIFVLSFALVLVLNYISGSIKKAFVKVSKR